MDLYFMSLLMVYYYLYFIVPFEPFFPFFNIPFKKSEYLMSGYKGFNNYIVFCNKVL